MCTLKKYKSIFSTYFQLNLYIEINHNIATLVMTFIFLLSLQTPIPIIIF